MALAGAAEILHAARGDVPTIEGAEYRSVPLDDVRAAAKASRGNRNLGGIAIRPGDPGWADKIIPPEEDHAPPPKQRAWNPQTQSAAPAPLVAPTVPTRRLVVSYGRTEGEFVLSVEEAPEWDMIATTKASVTSIYELMPIIAAFTDGKVKDYTGGDLRAALMEEEERAHPLRRGQGAREEASPFQPLRGAERTVDAPGESWGNHDSGDERHAANGGSEGLGSSGDCDASGVGET